jgi:hypothetical protein
MFFHSTLIWQPYSPITRRKAKLPDDAILPSWSWAGWHGTLQFESWRSGYKYTKSLGTEEDLEQSSWQTSETVRWYRLDDAGVKHTIKCTDERIEIPGSYDGWTKYQD